MPRLRSEDEGLSPRVRGKPVPCPDCGRKTKVYPRVCGGTAEALEDMERVGGLSPRVRGNRAGEYGCGRPAGSIPACAGEPRVTPLPDGVCRVYPRVCGGTQIRR